MPLDRLVDFLRPDLISHDTDPNRETGPRTPEGLQIDPHVLPVGKLRLHMRSHFVRFVFQDLQLQFRQGGDGP